MKPHIILCMVMLVSSARGRVVPETDSTSMEELFSSGDKLKLNKTNFFTDKRVVFSSQNEITNLVLMYKGELFDDSLASEEEESGLFFNQVQVLPDGTRVNLGQFVLVNHTAKKIFDGKCATTELGKASVYFGAADGLYMYDNKNQKAVRFGDVTDDIMKLQVTNGTDLIYYLAADHHVYTVDLQGKNKQRVDAVSHVKDFILDRKNNLYYYGEDMIPYVLKVGSSNPVKFTTFKSEKNAYLVRPGIFMDEDAVFVTDGEVYKLSSDGKASPSPFVLDVKPQPTSVNFDISVVQYYAIDGKIYEFNFILILLEAVFGDEGFLAQLVDRAKTYAG